MPSTKRTVLLGFAVAVAVAVSPLAVSAGASPSVVAPSASGSGSLDPANFTTDIDNPYFPLVPGTTNVYVGSRDGQPAVQLFEVTGKTKKILGVTTRVVHDRLYLDGVLFEDTIDWFVQDRAGTVWYFGEDTKTLDANGHVVSTAGSFQAGVQGARQGIFMPAQPVVGATFQQEFFPGHAEDKFTILSLTESVSVQAGSFTHVMLTNEFTVLEPTVRGGKNYAPGVGTIREFDTQGSNEHLDLITVLHSDDAP